MEEASSSETSENLLKNFWVVARRQFLVYDQRFGIIHQKVKPGNNPKNFKQHYDHGGSLQLHQRTYDPT
jgi:hypothetical protein